MRVFVLLRWPFFKNPLFLLLRPNPAAIVRRHIILAFTGVFAAPTTTSTAATADDSTTTASDVDTGCVDLIDIRARAAAVFCRLHLIERFCAGRCVEHGSAGILLQFRFPHRPVIVGWTLRSRHQRIEAAI